MHGHLQLRIHVISFMADTEVANVSHLCAGSCSGLLSGGLGSSVLCSLTMRRLPRFSLIDVVHLQRPFSSQLDAVIDQLWL